jgi:flagellum-specific peptidoglycan hydrolase FlgJ
MTFRSTQQTRPVTTYDNTWAGVKAAAKVAGAKYPEVVAAQWALESGYGKHTSGKNNFFGLKGSGTERETKEFINGKWITIRAGFIDFPDLQTCVSYLVERWYLDYKQYKGVNRAVSREDCARLLQKEGYATDPSYPEKLIRLMNENG